MLKYLHNLVKRISIGLVGDFNEKIHTLVALDRSIAHVAANLGFQVDATWIPTPTITKTVLIPLNSMDSGSCRVRLMSTIPPYTM